MLTIWKERKLVLLTYSDCRLSWGLKREVESLRTAITNVTSWRYCTRHLDVLPKKHSVVYLIIDHCHLSHLISGPQLTQSFLSGHGWTISARCFIRSRILKCVRWFKVKPTSHGWHPSIPFDSSQTFSP